MTAIRSTRQFLLWDAINRSAWATRSIVPVTSAFANVRPCSSTACSGTWSARSSSGDGVASRPGQYVSTASCSDTRPTSHWYSIWSAASRALWRLAGSINTRGASPRSARAAHWLPLVRAWSCAESRGPRLRMAQRAIERRHLDRGVRRLAPLVVLRPVTGTRGRLLHRVGRQHTEGHWHARVPRRDHDPVRHRGRDVVEVRRLAANHAPEADDRVEAAGFGRSARGLRQLVRARYVVHLDVLGAAFEERIQRPALQAGRDPLVEARDD